MADFLRATWLSVKAMEEGQQNEILLSFRKLLENAWPGKKGEHSIYRLLSEEREAIPSHALLDMPVLPMPNYLILTPIDSTKEALDYECAVKKIEIPEKIEVVTVATFREVFEYRGSDFEKFEDKHAPAIQFGTYSMPDTELEWGILDWYENRRIPRFASGPGAIRARFYVSFIGGYSKYAVFYEFLSLEQRKENFLHLEYEDHAYPEATAATSTIHTPWSPSIGPLVSL